MKNKQLINPILVGTLLGFLEGILIMFGDPNVGNLILIQSIIFWFGVGVIIYISNTGLSIYKHSVFITLF